MKRLIPLFLVSVSTVYADCPYDPRQSAYVCDNAPRPVTERENTQHDVRGTAEQVARYGARTRGGCAPLIKDDVIIHYDCTTHGLQSSTEIVERYEYRTHWQLAEERASQLSADPEATAERGVSDFARGAPSSRD